ncbi:MAG TPA: 2-oxo-4-hydroxy-4-carboxy-5-ureidoimidazoline decarboxylase [Jatrophihabitans sp.]|nr:2-oxo-4-hydroxy-4-carboxy-5-ureidoimidazoline decarboxylase [Jatrophihabitans sp.]
MTLADLNTTPDRAALAAQLGACCAAHSWVARVIDGRPYPDLAALGDASDAATAALDEEGLREALAGHPRIGERRTEHVGEWSRQEQAGMSDAGDQLRADLAAANAAYEARFGHVYLVCATGKSASELLELCRTRLGNDVDTERQVILAELAKINRLRLGKLLDAEV